MLGSLITFLAGVLLLFKGADLFVEGGEGLALRYNISPTIIGLTVVAFGTSLPELLVSVEAVLTGTPGIASGNVVGSNIANIGLILGLSAILAPAMMEGIQSRHELHRTAVLMLLATLLYGILSLRSVFDRISGIIFLCSFLLVMIVLWRSRTLLELRESPEGDRPILFTLIGLGGVILGAHFLLMGAVAIAELFQIPTVVIGLSMVAVGTSLPELATSIIALARGSHGISIGNILGSNLFNLLFILGSASLVGDVPPTDVSITLILVIFSLGMIPLVLPPRRWTRVWGGFLFILYFLYLFLLYRPL